MKYTVNNKTYSLKIFWEHITLQDAVEISKIKIAADDFFKLMDKEIDEIDDNDREYIIEVLRILSTTPKTILKKIKPEYLFLLWAEVKDKVNGLFNFNFESYKSLGFEGFNFKGKYYKLPKYIVIDDKPVLCYNEPSKNIIEALNIAQVMSTLKNEGISYMRYLCAIYLKEEDEEFYDEEKITKRAELFKTLPMSIVLECFFFIYIFGNLLITNSLLFSLKRRRKEKLMKVLYLILGSISLLIHKLQALFKKSKDSVYGSYSNYLNFLLIKTIRKRRNLKK